MTRLTVSDYFKDRPTSLKGAYWGVKGVRKTSANIVMVTPDNKVIEEQYINVNKSHTYRTGHVAKVTNVLLAGTASYADVNVTAPYGVPEITIPTVPEPPAPAGTTLLQVLIPNRDGTFKTYSYNVTIPGIVAPTPEVPITVCTEGQKSGPITCWDGSVIYTMVCRNRVIVPTGEVCPPKAMAKLVKIITSPGMTNLPNAYEGQEVVIDASVMCGTKKSQHEQAILLVDGAEYARSKTGENGAEPGFVTFRWTATAKTGLMHRICVSVPESTLCPNYSAGMDCKIIMVSSVIPSIEERLKLEREQLGKRLESLRTEKELVRERIITEAREEIPVELPVIELPTVPEFEMPVEELPPVPPAVPETGTIYIPSIPAPPKIDRLPQIYIDGNFEGPPPLRIDVEAGVHNIKAELKGFKPLYKKVTVIGGETITITDLSFII